MIRINERVKTALEEGKPVVALESTIISHGMPYPKNVETALKVEQVIKDHGAIPATIGIIDGEPIVAMPLVLPNNSISSGVMPTIGSLPSKFDTMERRKKARKQHFPKGNGKI